MACRAAFSQEDRQNADAIDVSIAIDPAVLEFAAAPDGNFIKRLHDRSEKALLANLGIQTDGDGLRVGPISKKRLAFHRAYDVHGERRHAFVYIPCIQSFPGYQPLTIVICDGGFRPLDWQEVGGSPIFESAEFAAIDAEPILRINLRHRHTFANPERGIYKFSLRDDKIGLPNAR